MISLKDIKNDLSSDVIIKGVTCDSRKVEPGYIFVAIQGEINRGEDFIDEAIIKGASVIVTSLDSDLKLDIPIIKDENPRRYLSYISSIVFNNSPETVCAITGTNGKTSTVYYLASLFRQLNFKVGLISTIDYQVHNTTFKSSHTTPNPIELNRLLSKMVISGCQYCFMEVSSHGISQNRIASLDFDVAVFSNISRDHLDYHRSWEKYVETKKHFFDNLSKDAISVVNIDDEFSQTMILDTKSKKIFFGLNSLAHFHGSILESNIDSLTVDIDGHNISTRLSGDFNIYNLLATYSVARQLLQDNHDIVKLLSNISPVPGRFNTTSTSSNIYGIVDYAHSPDALNKVILSISKFCSIKRDLIIVLGCGGNRDIGKRYKMGQIASNNSRHVIFTSDNPRFESPSKIIADMYKGVSNSCQKQVSTIINREDAIKSAVKLASPGSVILVAGKGHEKFQEYKGKKTPFDDMEILTKYLKQ